MSDTQETPPLEITIDPLEIALTAMQGMLANPRFVTEQGNVDTAMIGIMAWEMPAHFMAGLKWQQDLQQLGYEAAAAKREAEALQAAEPESVG